MKYVLHYQTKLLKGGLRSWVSQTRERDPQIGRVRLGPGRVNLAFSAETVCAFSSCLCLDQFLKLHNLR